MTECQPKHLEDKAEALLENLEEALEEALDIVADLEEYAKRLEKPPLCRAYRIRINGKLYEVDRPSIKGREVLQLAGLEPPEKYSLRVKIAGQPPRKVGLNETVDLRTVGIEKFKALPQDQTEGEI